MKLILSRFIQSVINEVHEELEHKKINFRPEYYISNEWGCPDRIPIIGIPYSFCYPIFTTFEEDGVIVDKDPVRKIIRHEIGHTLNYAYKLYEREDWKHIFGDFNKPYNLNEAAKYVNPFSKDFVVNLPDYNYCYAQLHPDESWSETFAVWVKSTYTTKWVHEYSGRYTVLGKLWTVNNIMKEVRNLKPKISNGKKHKPYSNLILKGR